MSRRHEITLTQLRYFATAAEHRSMTDAARELFVAQSAVSAAIGQLEQAGRDGRGGRALFVAAPVPVEAFASFPVRAYATVPA